MDEERLGPSVWEQMLLDTSDDQRDDDMGHESLADENTRNIVELTDEMLRGVLLDDGPSSLARHIWHHAHEL